LPARLFIIFLIACSAAFRLGAREYISQVNSDSSKVEINQTGGDIPGEDSLTGSFQGHISLAWENDMFFLSDYYYTNGSRIEFFHDKLRQSPFSRILIPTPQKETSIDLHGLQLHQEIYTPKDLAADSISLGDHPYSANLTLTQVKITSLPERGIFYTTGFKLGVIGPASLGYLTQRLAHLVSNPSRPPLGWEYQIRNDLIINYDLEFEKTLSHKRSRMVGFQGRSRLGTMHTDLAAGMWIRMNNREASFERIEPPGDKAFNFSFHLASTMNYIVYDASLQGGVFNKTSPYTIPNEDLNRWLGRINATASFGYREHQIVCYTQWISKRFKSSIPHAWMGISYKYWY